MGSSSFGTEQSDFADSRAPGIGVSSERGDTALNYGVVPTSGNVVGIDALVTGGQGLFSQPPGMISLPLPQSENFVSQRHEVNPALALNLLQDIQTVVAAWQEQLRQLVQAMHVLHGEGPMVDGWLESSLSTVPPVATTASDASLLRHGDTDALMQYVDALEAGGDLAEPVELPAATEANSSFDEGCAQYRLCSFDGDGNVRSQLCPPAQMALVSMAIARYQKFKQLAQKKQVIEIKLQQAVDQLTGIRSELTQLS